MCLCLRVPNGECFTNLKVTMSHDAYTHVQPDAAPPAEVTHPTCQQHWSSYKCVNLSHARAHIFCSPLQIYSCQAVPSRQQVAAVPAAEVLLLLQSMLLLLYLLVAVGPFLSHTNTAGGRRLACSCGGSDSRSINISSSRSLLGDRSDPTAEFITPASMRTSFAITAKTVLCNPSRSSLEVLSRAMTHH